jgi:large subunit ribosomal protein L21
MIAVIETGGKQYIAKPGAVLTLEKLEGEVGSTISFDRVLLASAEDGSNFQVGSPVVSGVTVTGKIVAQGRSKKLRVVKYKRKVRYKRVIGHRQHQTKVEITEVK